ncbi:MAG: hypothetical protein DMF87_16520 [Acidobacteria bacterium]|nr:MAG: hypothetical protein DMF87_16520 [Acidobacteriota bacterium]
MKRFFCSTMLCSSVLLVAAPARADSLCDPDGFQGSGSIYRICMPAPAEYNGMLVVWAHGFQDAGSPVAIPEDQLCFTSTFCLPSVLNGLGFAFATNSYSKTGLAVLQGKDDVVDLVRIFAQTKGQPSKVYLVGASEGGIITTLAVEQRTDLFAAGLAACGPIGSFPLQINYFGDARATFEYFFPGLIPGDPFHPDLGLTAIWSDYYTNTVEPIVFQSSNRHLLDQWVRAAKLPFDADNYLDTVRVSARDVLRYSVVNVNDAAATLGGFPFDNRSRWYTGSDNDLLLNIFVQRVGAIASGAWLTRHLNIPIDRFEHCNFTQDEALFAFAVMLFYDSVLGEVSGTASALSTAELDAFERRARAVGLPVRRAGERLHFALTP